MTDQGLTCTHEEFDASVGVARIMSDDDSDPQVVGYSAEIKVNCRDCQEPFRWSGVRTGLVPNEPMCSADGTELRAPLRPASEDGELGVIPPVSAVRFQAGGEG